MLTAYINYPNPHIQIHSNLACYSIRKHHKENQRTVMLNIHSLAAEVGNFADKEYKFAADAENNDMWLSVDFDDMAFEKSVILYLRNILSRHYSPFKDCPIHEHPCS